MTAHTNFQQGQHVFVQLRNGEKFEDEFFERRARFVVLKKRGRVPIREVRAISVKRSGARHG